MKKLFFLGCFTALLFLTTPAQAQSNFDLSELEQGEVLLNISATEREEVEQDLLVGNVSYMAEGQDSTALQNTVNKAIKEALALAIDYPDVEVSTQQYYVYLHEPYPRPLPTDKGGEPAAKKDTTWRATQSLQLRSENSEQLLGLAGKLQAIKLTMNNLAYELSAKKREQITDTLLAGALTKLQNRANEAAQILGKSSASLVEIAVESGSQYQPRMMAMASDMARSEAMQAPQAVPGMAEVTLTVSARALLRPQ